MCGIALFMAGGQVYEVTSTDRSQDVEILTTYVERDILQSGWLLGEQVIAKKAAAVAVKHGAGKVVMIGFRPQHRDQTHGTLISQPFFEVALTNAFIFPLLN